jgi:hypothetical protein
VKINLQNHPAAGYKYSCSGSAPLAGFEVIKYGRFSGGHRGKAITMASISRTRVETNRCEFLLGG